MKITDFSIGRRWRVKSGNYRNIPFEFVIIGPGETYAGKPSGSAKMCRLVTDKHNHTPGCSCSHGMVQTYGHKHLRRYATLLPLDAPEQETFPISERDAARWGTRAKEPVNA